MASLTSKGQVGKNTSCTISADAGALDPTQSLQDRPMVNHHLWWRIDSASNPNPKSNPSSRKSLHAKTEPSQAGCMNMNFSCPHCARTAPPKRPLSSAWSDVLVPPRTARALQTTPRLSAATFHANAHAVFTQKSDDSRHRRNKISKG